MKRITMRNHMIDTVHMRKKTENAYVVLDIGIKQKLSKQKKCRYVV